jgi:hypothetical protein
MPARAEAAMVCSGGIRTIRIHSTSIGDERANVYLYPLLDETKIF